MDDILARLSEISADPYSSVAKTRERTGKKAIAVFPMHIPEEIVHAAGMLPVVVWRGNEPVTLGHSHVATFNCGLVRSFVDDAVRGKLAFLDGVVLWRQCLQAQGLRYIIERSAHPPFDYLEYLYLPALFPDMKSSPGAAVKDFLLEELGRLKTGMEKLAGRKVTIESLRHSIAIYNRDRDLIRQAYELRRQRPGILSAMEAMAIVHSSMLMPKEEHTELLEKLLPELKRRKAAANGKVRVVLAGALCQTPQTDILDLVEELGMTVVDDDIYVGSRYFARNARASGDPLEALADRYLERTPPCPTLGDWQSHWGDYLVDKVRSRGARGVVTLFTKFCPPHLCYYPDVKSRLAEAGIPEVMLEMEHEIISLEGARTRLQSFVETVKGV